MNLNGKKIISVILTSFLFAALIILMFLALIFSNLAYGAYGAIPAWERGALIALYNSTNGDNWVLNSGWKAEPLEADGFGPIGTENNWFGVYVKGDHVTEIGLHFCRLTGNIPPELGNLGELVHLHLGWNSLSGCIPPELGNLSKLLWLDLKSNQLTGGIPPELGNLENLRALFLEDNRLSGSIPAELGNLSDLKYLRLNGNRLTGSIPTTLTNLTYLAEWGDDGGQNHFSIHYNGLYTNDTVLWEFLASKIHDGWERYQTTAPTGITAAAASFSSIGLSWIPIKYTKNTGGYMVYYSTAAGGPWTYAGITPDKTASSFEVTGLSMGTLYYFMVKTRTDPHYDNANTVVSDESEIECGALGSIPPFGSFDTPLDGSTVRGSIPVTGWALDDIGIKRIKICREAEADGSLVYIGDAVLVEGARPDIQQGYPGYPNNHRAGWGYMMLTNFLPNGGNGTFTIHAIAADIEGNQATLGTKTIFCDNANAVKPFGAIDTPEQGGPASGSGFVNFGWVLTPLPNTIPIDGSTITVWVDGVPVGHPVYNQYRADIAALFPNYNNSSGAVGYFYLDTTAYENGVHTIQWTAADDAGNSDGIGSRYFTIQNSPQDAKRAVRHEGIRRGGPLWPPISDGTIPVDYSTPVRIKKGFNKTIEPQIVYPGDDGTIYIEIKELERLEIHPDDPGDEIEIEEKGKDNPEFIIHNSKIYAVCMMVGNEIRPLPIGSSLDFKTGAFYWQPGPGFMGKHRLVFIYRQQGGERCIKFITVNIGAKSF